MASSSSRLSALRRLGSRTCSTILAAGLLQLACQAPPPASLPPQAEIAAIPAAAPREAPDGAGATDRYDLERDERRGGHTLARHVGLSDADLRERLSRERGISAASTYTDRITAERIVALALAQHRTRIDRWLAREGPRPNLALEYQAAGEPIGRSLLRRGRRAVMCSDAVIVLRWDRRDGFYVLTSYPESR